MSTENIENSLPKKTLEQVLRPDKAYSVREIASLLGIQVNSTRQKLKKALDKGIVTKHVVDRQVLWALKNLPEQPNLQT